MIEENMLEIDTTAITPAPVLQASGHVDKFAGWMCKDPVRGDYLRADHLVQSVLETRLDNYKTKGENKRGENILDDDTVKEYEAILAKVSVALRLSSVAQDFMTHRSMIE